MDTPWFDAPAPLLPEILALNGRWMGDKPAVICDDTVLSWRMFHARICQVANGLRAGGLEPGDRVAVLMDNSPEMLITLFGIIVAGGVTVPLNVMVSDAGLTAMIQDADARALVVSEAHAGRIERSDEHLSRIRRDAWLCHGAAPSGWQDFSAWIEAQDDTDPCVPLEDGDACNII